MSMLAILAATSIASAEPTTYTLDAKQGDVYVIVYKDPDTMGAGLSHDHAVRAYGWSGSVTWDPDNPGGCSVDVTVPVNKLIPDEDRSRKMAGFDNTLDAGDRDTIKEKMLGEDQLWGSKHPTISFKGSSCSGSGDSIKVSGKVTVRGKSKPVSVNMKVSADGSSLSAKGSFKA